MARLPNHPYNSGTMVLQFQEVHSHFKDRRKACLMVVRTYFQDLLINNHIRKHLSQIFNNTSQQCINNSQYRVQRIR